MLLSAKNVEINSVTRFIAAKFVLLLGGVAYLGGQSSIIGVLSARLKY